MKHAIKLLLVLVILAFSSPAAGQDAAVQDTLLTPAQWMEFNENIAEAILSENEGVKVGALRQIIRYGHFLDMDRVSSFDVMRIYRNHKDDPMRRMAVLALGNMEDRWAVEFLDMLSEYEESETIRKTMEEVVSAYWEAHGGNPYQ